MFKKIWFQIHWFVGITAGTLLMVVGVTGALLSFEDEILDILNPGIITVTPQDAALATPEQLLQSVQRQQPGRGVSMLIVYDAKDKATWIMFAPPPGQRKGEIRYLNPYDGQILPVPQYKEVFKFIERLHRWFLLPVDNGKLLSGFVASGMLILALSGLYLRWPKRIFSWKSWFKIDFRLKGRPFLWTLHSVIGTWALVMYLVAGATGVYWSFGWVRNVVDVAAGLRPRTPSTPPHAEAQAKPALPPTAGAGDKPGPQREKGEQPRTEVADGAAAQAAPGSDGRRRRHERQEQKEQQGADEPSAAVTPAKNNVLDLSVAWTSFNTAVTDYEKVILRFPPAKNGPGPINVSYTDHASAHERAFNTMQIDPLSGAISKRTFFNDKKPFGYIVGSVYTLHTGSFFGMPGRIIMLISSGMMPLFGITGWMLYLKRRRTKRQLKDQRVLAADGMPHADGARRVRVLHASQTGYAEKLALETATALRAGGMHAVVQPLSRFNPDEVTAEASDGESLLFVVSTFGEGEAPDLTKGFVNRIMRATGRLAPANRYAVLALGDRHYSHFCEFGHSVYDWMKAGGGEPLLPLIEVDSGDPLALEHWRSSVLGLFGIEASAQTGGEKAAAAGPTYSRWKLVEREWLNPGSPGKPLFKIRLEPQGGGLTMWHSGALADILPCNGPAKVQAALQQTGFSGHAGVTWQGHPCTLELALLHADLSGGLPAATTPAELVAALKPLAVRTYSIASTGLSGAIELLVRQSWDGDVLGVASGWLTEYAPEGAIISLLVRDNPHFELVQDGVPCLFIGNGSGLAGLMSHLRTRSMNGHGQNWLIYGERTRAADSYYKDEIQLMLDQRDLTYLDLAFSRDSEVPELQLVQPSRKYVQDCLLEQQDSVREWLEHDAVIYVCGSLKGMGTDVNAALVEILGQDALDELTEQGRYRRDVY